MEKDLDILNRNYFIFCALVLILGFIPSFRCCFIRRSTTCSILSIAPNFHIRFLGFRGLHLVVVIPSSALFILLSFSSLWPICAIPSSPRLGFLVLSNSRITQYYLEGDH